MEDKAGLQQFLANASKYTPDKGRIEVVIKKISRANCWYDNGIG